MTSIDLMLAIGQAEDKYIAEAERSAPAGRRRIRRYVPIVAAGVAAALAVCIFAVRDGGNREAETSTPPEAEAPVGIPGEKMPGNTAPLPPVYPEGDYYYISYRASNREPEIDFASLFDELTGNSGASDTAPEDLIAENPAVYEELMSHGDETLFYCLCLSARNLNLIGKDECDAKTSLAVYIVEEMTREDEYVARFLGGGLNSHSFNMLWRAIMSDYSRYGNEWLTGISSKLYQFVRAVVSVPDLRLNITECDGEIYNSTALFNATLAFGYVLDRADTESSRKLANDVLPNPPEDVCNEYTSWSMTQAEDGSVTLTFTGVTDGAFKGSLTYYPTEDEMATVSDGEGNMVENTQADAAGFVEAVYAGSR